MSVYTTTDKCRSFSGEKVTICDVEFKVTLTD
jgi:hypothetical protein